MSTKLIPASELREGYTLVLPDGSSRVIIYAPLVTVAVRLDDRNTMHFEHDEQVTVKVEQDEF